MSATNQKEWQVLLKMFQSFTARLFNKEKPWSFRICLPLEPGDVDVWLLEFPPSEDDEQMMGIELIGAVIVALGALLNLDNELNGEAGNPVFFEAGAEDEDGAEPYCLIATLREPPDAPTRELIGQAVQAAVLSWWPRGKTPPQITVVNNSAPAGAEL